MNTFYYDNGNLCSIAGVDASFSGNVLYRKVIMNLLEKVSVVSAKIERPYSIGAKPRSLGGESASQFGSIEHDEDWSSFRFEYPVFTNTDHGTFIDLVSDVWFDYEQPTLTFICGKLSEQYRRELRNDRVMTWKEIVTLAHSYVVFKDIQEDVVWIGKSSSLIFDFE